MLFQKLEIFRCIRWMASIQLILSTSLLSNAIYTAVPLVRMLLLKLHARSNTSKEVSIPKPLPADLGAVVAVQIYFSFLGVFFGIIWLLGAHHKKVYCLYIWILYAIVIFTLKVGLVFWAPHVIPLLFVISSCLVCIVGFVCSVGAIADSSEDDVDGLPNYSPMSSLSTNTNSPNEPYQNDSRLNRFTPDNSLCSGEDDCFPRCRRT